MFVTVVYSKEQLEAAIKFIAENNRAFKGKKDYIRKSIQSSINEMLVKFPDLNSISTMGYHIIGSVEEVEGIDHDSNRLMVEIMVDPGLALDWESVEEVRFVSRKGS
jgi:hypothetical protein